MKANVKRPARFSFKTITEKKAKHLTLIFVAVLFLVIVVLALFPLLDREEERYEVTTYAMGSYVQQTVYGENREDAAVKAADAVEALEQKISWRVANSDIQKLNNNAGKDWVTLSDETLNVLTQAQSVSEKSGGAFDVTIAPISRLWDFDDELNEVPDSDLITSLLPYVNYSLLRIDETEQTASLKNLGMAVDLGSVGKGAACDAAVRAYEEAGAKAAIIAVGGSVGVYGEKSSGKPWSVAVRDPNGDGSLGSVTLAEGFVSTSGSYEKYFEQDGVLYHHLLDPKTGYPAESGLVSVTVVAKSGVLSDALSTACFVLGREDGMKLLEEFDAEGIFINSDNNITVTDGLKAALHAQAAITRLFPERGAAMEKRKFSWKEALLLVLVLAVAAGVYLYAKTRPKGAEAVIEQDGEVYRRVVLADLKEPLTLEVNGAVIELDKDGAHFVSSPCPDKICVNKGIIKRAGESAVCLPQRVGVRIEGGDSEIDSVTG